MVAHQNNRAGVFGPKNIFLTTCELVTRGHRNCFISFSSPGTFFKNGEGKKMKKETKQKKENSSPNMVDTIL